MSDKIRIALAGNPNTGKTSLFNALTGMNQRVGNYPGITVDKKIGFFNISDNKKVELIDLPGTYSLNPSSLDEEVVLNVLTDKGKEYPDAVIFVADASNLKRNLYFFSQIKDLGIPTVLALNMVDVLERRGTTIDIKKLSEELNCTVLTINARKGIGVSQLKNSLLDISKADTKPAVDLNDIAPKFLASVSKALSESNGYIAWVKSVQDNLPNFLSEKEKKSIEECIANNNDASLKKLKIKETIKRYQFVNNILKKTVTENKENDITLTGRIDKIVTHKVFGYIIFFSLMMLLFQAIYAWASIPMNFIDQSFSQFAIYLDNNLPAGVLTNLITQGIVPGIGGIVIFIPQIAILFAFISTLEDTGYMSRVVFLMDKLMRKFGMSGKSIVPLMSGMACAVPAIMSTRTIENWKERLLTIFVTPFITCSARLPVYTIIIALIIPEEEVLGIFNLQGLVLMFMYLVGFFSALLSAYIGNFLLKIKTKSNFIIEMPSYKVPYYKNIGLDIIEKTKAFIFNAGKIIFSMSIVLWVLASYGPGNNIEEAEVNVKIENPNLSGLDLDNEVASYKLEHSYIGKFGHFIEPSIKPLGYDWKIGIALISSLAAREVFVSTMATIYSVGSSSDTDGTTVIKRMQGEINPETGEPVYTFAVGWSLLIFYAFAMQCVSTIAIVKKETNSWKWPIIQTIYMTTLAYLSSFIVYQLLK